MATREQSLTEIRRDLHRYPEEGWTEFRTTALVAEELDERGFDLHLGPDAVDPEERLGVPDEERLDAALERARELGSPEEYLERMEGVTGLVAVKRYGDGPVVSVRVDMDALARDEAEDDDHRPAREGFASEHPGEMHACGHDGHTAIGLGIARELDEHGGFDGTLKLFFQPAEEGGRGGKPMSETTHLDDVDHMLALHLGLGEETGTVVAGYDRPLSNAKLDVTFHGEPAHAGGQPHAGRNAAQVLGAAIQNLYAIPRHGDGKTRVNVGQVRSPNAQNVISERAEFRIEVRGETADLNEYMLGKARTVVEHAAGMHECEHETSLYGKTTTFECDESMVDAVSEAAEGVDSVTDVKRRKEFGGSEDASYLIRRVQENGGDATYVGVGASNVAGHHTAYFDIDEDALEVGVDVTCETIRSL
ncbi:MULTISPECIES: amidohydrolase [Halolamina]|uniref:Aminobenzoyl-glutamate utilization protein A n=1 Tax=Halolamina pelagica TaxID=699431 RepID=A0A1I5W720_9EURY|nr:MULTISPECIES: amidohydrolase [Halolamina]NHX37510.1 M20 family metallo-hydrolase [Halolamina sp. R1-12]SFQ15554.1 aminobenzoyl-glutamate utilization protein A [Halolamina pelagica]